MNAIDNPYSFSSHQSIAECRNSETMCISLYESYCNDTTSISNLWEFEHTAFEFQSLSTVLSLMSGLCYLVIAAAIYFNK